MNLDEWRSNAEHSKELRKLISSPIFQTALEVIKTMSPVRQVMAREGDSDYIQKTGKYQLGKQVGFEMWPTCLDELCTDPKPIQQPRETYNVKPETPWTTPTPPQPKSPKRRQ